MKTVTVTLPEASLEALHKYLGRADLKGREVPEFLRLLQELRPSSPPAAEPPGPAPAPSR